MTKGALAAAGRRLYSVPVGLLLGVLLAWAWPSGAGAIGWIGDVFLSLLKLLILPLILVSIYASLAGSDNLRRLGAGTLLLYLLTSAVAATLGTVLGWVWSRDLPTDLMAPAAVDTGGAGFSMAVFVERLIPSNLVASMAEGNILHIVVVAIAAAIASRALPSDQRGTLLDLAEAGNALLMSLLRLILALAPLGVLGLVYASLAAMDWQAVLQLHAFVWAVALAALLHAGVFLPLLLLLGAGRGPWGFIAAVREALLMALTTASSSATYPVSKDVLERNVGLRPATTSFTLPLGATLNMDGSALYQSILLIFIAQLAGADLSLAQALLIVLLTMASSAGTAGIPGGGIAMMAFMLDLLGLPQTWLALYLVVDRFFDYPITALNVWGDLVVAAVVDRRTEATA
jgi:Na+/H+-dicarboxylate symporter